MVQQNSSQSSKNNKSRSSGQRRNRNRRNDQSQGAKSKSSHSNRRHGSKNQGNRHRRSGNKINLDPVFKQYCHFLDEVILARKKYFENFYRVDEKKKSKLENAYLQKIKEFNLYEEKLSEEERLKLSKMFPNSQKDTTYSENHDLLNEDHQTKSLAEIEVVDPHFLESQKTANYAEDTEESTGTIEDYKKYKGIV